MEFLVILFCLLMFFILWVVGRSGPDLHALNTENDYKPPVRNEISVGYGKRQFRVTYREDESWDTINKRIESYKKFFKEAEREEKARKLSSIYLHFHVIPPYNDKCIFCGTRLAEYYSTPPHMREKCLITKSERASVIFERILYSRDGDKNKPFSMFEFNNAQLMMLKEEIEKIWQR